MNSTTPQDLLDLKSRIDLWRSTRRFIRQPIPDDIRLAIVQAASRHSPRLVKKVLKLDPYRFKPASSSTKKPAKSVSSIQQIDFATLAPPTDPLPDHALCHLQINRKLSVRRREIDTRFAYPPLRHNFLSTEVLHEFDHSSGSTRSQIAY